ncbi:hypothetical protein [Scytonema sp. NUACC26]|uniref:hypothetical protein n=1 Tax=Scytonema sp. NUACC26 TaxID=3140176 RepID=UPI0038B3D0A7
MSAPIIPFTSVKLFDALQLSETDRMTKISESVNFKALPLGHAVYAIAKRKLKERLSHHCSVSWRTKKFKSYQ